jgi:hypothetical protein
MCKVQNRNMESKIRQGNMNPQKAHNLTKEDLVNSEGSESPFAQVRRMVIRMFNCFKVELKKNVQNRSLKLKRTWTKKTQENTETNN